MLATQSRRARRAEESLFDPKNFYTFINPTIPDWTLSSGINQRMNGDINMTKCNTYSSENWQLFYQSGRYFIRNYDYAASWQLGLTKDSKIVPSFTRGVEV